MACIAHHSTNLTACGRIALLNDTINNACLIVSKISDRLLALRHSVHLTVFCPACGIAAALAGFILCRAYKFLTAITACQACDCCHCYNGQLSASLTPHPLGITGIRPTADACCSVPGPTNRTARYRPPKSQAFPITGPSSSWSGVGITGLFQPGNRPIRPVTENSSDY